MHMVDGTSTPHIGQVDVEPVFGHRHICAGRAPKTHERMGARVWAPGTDEAPAVEQPIVSATSTAAPCMHTACPQPCKRTGPKEPYERRRMIVSHLRPSSGQAALARSSSLAGSGTSRDERTAAHDRHGKKETGSGRDFGSVRHGWRAIPLMHHGNRSQDR